MAQEAQKMYISQTHFGFTNLRSTEFWAIVNTLKFTLLKRCSLHFQLFQRGTKKFNHDLRNLRVQIRKKLELYGGLIMSLTLIVMYHIFVIHL